MSVESLMIEFDLSTSRYGADRLEKHVFVIDCLSGRACRDNNVP